MSPSKLHPEGRIAPPASRKLGATIAAVVLLTLGLGACGGGPRINTGQGADPSAARGQLVAAAANGPVPLEVDRAPPVYEGGAPEVARVASRAADWLGARFAATPLGEASDRKRLVFRFEDTPGTPAETCAGKAPPGRLPPLSVKLNAVFCDGPRPVADATGTADGTDLAATDRLVTATVDRLFPGRTGGGSYYGYPGVSLGGVIGLGIGSGRRIGSGIFAGVHF
jgi:hypothetical protein